MTDRLTAKEVFDRWALDYHADGMEGGHWPSVREAFELIPRSSGVYLEIGVGNGYGLAFMAQNQYRDGQCIGIDVSPNMVDNAARRTAALPNVNVYEADFLSFSPPKSPDLIFSMEVFYYLQDMDAGLRHAHDLLTPGGMLMVLVNHYAERLDSHAWPEQLNTRMQLWPAAEYIRGFERAGFEDVEQQYFGVPSDEKARAINPGTLGTWGRK